MVYATEDLEDALAATREFLFPFEWGRWWRLAVVSIFLSSGSALNPPTAELSAPSWFGPLDGRAPVADERGHVDALALDGLAGGVEERVARQQPIHRTLLARQPA